MLDVRKLDLDSPEQPVERITVAQPMELATTRYQNWREDSGYLPVGITVGRPRFFRHSYVSLNALAPYELMKGPLAGVNDIPLERRVYRERLRLYEHEILAGLQQLGREYPCTPAALLCFEKVAEAGEACHRRWAAEWFQERYGWDVPELEPPAGAAPSQPRKPKPPTPETLF